MKAFYHFFNKTIAKKLMIFFLHPHFLVWIRLDCIFLKKKHFYIIQIGIQQL